MWKDIIGGLIGGSVVALISGKLQQKQLIWQKRLEVKEDFFKIFPSVDKLMDEIRGRKISIGASSLISDCQKIVCNRIYSFFEDKKIRKICEGVESLCESKDFIVEYEQMMKGEIPNGKIEEFHKKCKELCKLLKRRPI